MDVHVLLTELRQRGISLEIEGGALRYHAPAGALTTDLRTCVVAHRAGLVKLLGSASSDARRVPPGDQSLTESTLDGIAARWKPGEPIAYRDAHGRLEVAKYAGISLAGCVNVWTHDGITRALPTSSIAMDCLPDAAEMLEERLAIMLEAGVPEEVARVNAEACTRDFLSRQRSR